MNYLNIFVPLTSVQSIINLINTTYMKSKTTFSKSDNREQYEYARTRTKKKKNLMRHFIFFLAGAILFLIMDLALGFGKDSLPLNWSSYLILFWFFILLVHTLNVFLLNTFMGKEWEDRQLEKLKNKQMERILALQKKIEKEYPISDKSLETNYLNPKTNTDLDENIDEDTDHSRFQP